MAVYKMDEIEKMFPTSKPCPCCNGSGLAPTNWKLGKGEGIQNG